MGAIDLHRIKRGVLLASVGAASLIPVASARACPPAHAPAWGYRGHMIQGVHGPAGPQSGGGSGGSVTGHRIG